jgi:hypothetical protein
MSIVERTPYEALVPRATAHGDGRGDFRRQALAGCQLGRALSEQLSADAEQSAIWAVGSVTLDDLGRFAPGH